MNASIRRRPPLHPDTRAWIVAAVICALALATVFTLLPA